MTIKRAEHIEAVRLRREGLLYRDLMQRFGVAKSTLWRWLKADGLVDGQSQRYTERRLLAQKKAAETVHRARLERTQAIMSRARQAIGSVTARDLWMIGTALYWAEGSKQKAHNVSTRVIFSNSDPVMVQLFLLWLQDICHLSRERLTFALYIHESANVERARQFWSSALQVPYEEFHIRLKRHNPSPHRKNIGEGYVGLVRVTVRQSADLNRSIAGWILGMCDALGSGVMGTHPALDRKIPGSTPGSPAIAADGDLDDNSELSECDVAASYVPSLN